MAVKNCCIETCNSSSSRSEDIGVTYHKYPKDTSLRHSWLSVTHQSNIHIDNSMYVCSLHFCKSDFKIYQDSKYVLKSDAIPSIFTWMPINPMSNKMDTLKSKDVNSDEKLHNMSSSSKESEDENVEAIKRYLERNDETVQNNEVKLPENMDLTEKIVEKMDEIEQGEPVIIGTSIMDMIVSQSEAKMEMTKDLKPLAKHNLSPKGNSVALSVGSEVEAKDFGEFWYPAKIVEVDYDEMEVLVHYENASKKHDEWISVSSPRLRPINKSSMPPVTVPSQEATPIPQAVETFKEEVRMDDKPKGHFTIGERCLARYRDNRRFIATITNDLGKGDYEIMFDDGFQWKCPISRLYKLKESMQSECLTVDTSMSPTASTPSPVAPGTGPSTGVMPNALLPFHTHLFDPTRDYLGSKSERREKKRKLNIKEIFNIGQKKRKKQRSPKEKVIRIVKERKPRVFRRKIKKEVEDEITVEIKTETKNDIPDAVASIIGTVAKNEDQCEIDSEVSPEGVEAISEVTAVQEGSDKITLDDLVDNSSTVSATEIEIPSDFDFQQPSNLTEPAMEEEDELENFEKPDDSKKEVIEKMKEVINKLEDGINRAEKVNSPKPEVIEDVSEFKVEAVEEVKPNINEFDKIVDCGKDKAKKKLSKIKKSKKLRLLQEKKVKKQVEKVKSELEEMKRQVEEMRKQMLLKTEELATTSRPHEMPESFLLPGEWCCKWHNGQPVGTVSEIGAESRFDGTNKPGLPRRSVQVEDKRLPEGWTKHMLRRSVGQSAGKWDVVLISPDKHRYHTKTDMRNFLENNKDDSLKPYEYALLDFGVHLKLARRMGWVSNTGEDVTQPATFLSSLSPLSPLTKRKSFGFKRKEDKKEKKKRRKKQIALRQSFKVAPDTFDEAFLNSQGTEIPLDDSTAQDGYVSVGSLKVQIVDNLLQCPADGCLKTFRNNTLIQMHIKHYHRELTKMLGATPKVLDLARKRTKPKDFKTGKTSAGSKVIKIKISRPPKRTEEPKPETKAPAPQLQILIPPISPKIEDPIPRSQDSPKLRQALVTKPVKRPKVLLPVRRPDPPEHVIEQVEESPGLDYDEIGMETTIEMEVKPQDFETEISTHTVTRPIDEVRRKPEKSRKCFSTISKIPISEDDEWYGVNSDLDTRSSFPGSGTPDSKTMDKTFLHQHAVSSESAEDQKDSTMYMFSETGERIKIEHMKREEIINCHCGFREEDGLMVQCELCLCWQHALCHNIQKESEVPEKYTCSICLNPRRGRRSKRFLHDQDRLYEGLLPGAKPCESLRRSHELSGNLLRIQDALHALRVKYYVATKKDHPKLYLWAKDWENAETNFTQERLNSDYSDLNIIINSIGKHNIPVKPEEVRDGHLDVRTQITEEADHERFAQRDTSNPLMNLSTTLSSPSGTSLDLPITTSELERLAKSVHVDQEMRNVTVPQPEAAIENSACRERLLRHVQRCQALIDARLDSIEAQVAELESQDPSFEDDETADYFPRTKQTVQMLMRDLDTMEELGIIT